MVTVADLGILRGVAAEGERLVVTITPTYSGCPALREIAHDLRHRLAASGFAEVDVRTALAPAWSSDWITAEGRRKLSAAGIAPPHAAPARSGPVPLAAHPDPRREPVTCPRCGSADTTQTAAFGATACKALFRCESCREPFEYVKDDLMAGSQDRLPPAHGGAGRPAHRRLGRGDLRRPARAGRTVRLRARAVADHPPRRGAPVLFDLRGPGPRAAHRGARGGGRRRLRLAGARGPARRRDRGPGAVRLVHPGPGRARTPRADRRGQRDHPGAVHRLLRARRAGQGHRSRCSTATGATTR